jgi:eukaryotic-like serine/threonine-protein kinase
MMTGPAEAPLPQLGRYRLIARLGEGGMAHVYLALVRGPADVAKLFVIKQLRPELASDEEFRAMFLDEVRLATRLSHPNIVQTYEFAEHEGQPLIAMEYLDGQPMHSVLTRVGRAAFPLALHVHVLAEVLAGLQYAHGVSDFDGTPLGVVHRDVSPQNAFITYDGQVKLMDFGIAKASGSAAVTRAGVVKGKAGYIAPEQLALSDVDGRADVFAVGVMLWEALAQRRLTLGLSDAVVLCKRSVGQWPSVDEIGGAPPPALVAICARATASHPDERYPNAKAFRDDLVAYLASIGAPPAAEALAALTSQHFAEERAKIKALVDQEFRAGRGTGEFNPSNALPSFATAPTADGSVPVHVVSVGTDGSGARPGADGVTPSRPYGYGPASSLAPAPDGAPGAGAKPASKRGRAVALGAGAALALAAFGLARAFSPPAGGVATGAAKAPLAPPSAAAPAPAAPPTAATAAAATAATAAATTAANTVQLSIMAKPGEAKVFLDGKLLGQNPFRGIVPHDPTLHQVSVSASGCEPQDRVVSFADDVTLAFSLRCRGGATSGGGRRSSSTKAEPSKVEPGTHLSERDGKKPKHNLQVDEADPYTK